MQAQSDCYNLFFVRKYEDFEKEKVDTIAVLWTTGVGTKISTIFFENNDKISIKYRKISLKYRQFF